MEAVAAMEDAKRGRKTEVRASLSMRMVGDVEEERRKVVVNKEEERRVGSALEHVAFTLFVNRAGLARICHTVRGRRIRLHSLLTYLFVEFQS